MYTRRDLLRLASAGTLIGWRKPGLARDPNVASRPSPFLAGNYAPVHEEVAVERLKIVGKLPEGLSGMYVRNGPNPRFPPLGKYHWFDGDGMLHGVRIRDGAASYRNRYVQTTGWKEEKHAGKALWSGLAMPPDVKRMASGQPPFKNAANTALAWHDGKLLALWEGGEPYEVRLPGLETVGPYTFDKRLKHACTAHPKIDATSGEMMFFGYSALMPVVQYSVANADGQLVSTVPIKLRKAVMMHDFAITRRYSIFMDLPVAFDMVSLAKGGAVMKYEPEAGSRFGIIPRHGTAESIRWFESPSCYAFHTLNAWEEDNEVVLLACRMAEFHDVGSLEPPEHNRNRRQLPVLYRWRFNLATGETREEPVDDVRADFPRVNDALLGRKTRYGYTMSVEMGSLVKYDFDRGTSRRHAFGPGRFGGEGVFVARPGGQDEDDGWLVTYVFDQSSQTSEMLVIDARDFSAPPVARILIPARIPHGFHGLWLGEGSV